MLVSRKNVVLASMLVLVLGACHKTKAQDDGDAAATPSASASTASTPRDDGSDEKPARAPIAAFSTDDDITKFLADYQDAQKKKQEEARKRADELRKKQLEAQAKNDPEKNKNGAAPPPPAVAPMTTPAPAAAPQAAAKGAAAESRAGAPKSEAKTKDSDSVTNNQVAGVDEGGIVKVHGDHLVILRRGRIFTVKVDGKSLQPVAAVDAFGPDIQPGGTWYDEMLVSGNTLVVIGYSYARGGTEVGVFDLDSVGGVAYRATYHLRGNDYYSARNYASRVVGQKLVFYTPQYLQPHAQDPFARFPAVRKWHSGAQPSEFSRVVAAKNVYRPAFDLAPQALHTVTTCDLAAKDLSCTATSILGPSGRVFYVSDKAVYVWMSEHQWDGEKSTQTSAVVKLPLDGGAPGAVKVTGGPIDQFSFSEDDKFLNVFVRAETNGDGMWGSQVTAGDVGVVRLPLGFFSEGSVASSPRHYTKLEGPKGWSLQNRFVGDVVLYGSQGYPSYRYHGSAPAEVPQSVYAYRLGEKAATVLPIGHSVDRLDALGRDGIVVGQKDKDLVFTSLSLKDAPKVASAYVRKNAAQAESRSHGFFYKPDTDDSGLLGLPILGAEPRGDDEGSAKVVFLKNQALDLSAIGELGSTSVGRANDACKASCVDWYGNARPLFLRGRIFALMGYEIVEGALEGGKIHEVRRTSFSPKAHGRPAEE